MPGFIQKMGFTPNKLPVIFPVPFEPGKEIVALGVLPSPAAEFSHLLYTEWTGGAETWTEEQKLNVASERTNNQD